MTAAGRQVAVVTGAASGIGLATVEGLSKDGYLVVGTDLAAAPPALAAVADLEWVQGDITSDATWAAVVAAAKRHDPLGAGRLVSCAGDIVVARLLETTVDDMLRLFDVNVLGTMRGMQALIPGMRARGDGAIAVVCSVDSLYTEEYMTAYAASKAALLQVVRSAALEYSADGLRVNAVLPGAVDTALLRRAVSDAPDPETALAAAASRVPSGKVLRPDEVASVLRFLVSDAASGMSGAAVPVDGGLTATYDYRGPEE